MSANRKLDYTFLIFFLVSFVDCETKTDSAAELFFKLLTSKILHNYRTLKMQLRYKLDLYNQLKSDSNGLLLKQGLKLLERHWKLSEMTSAALNGKINYRGINTYRSFHIAREIIDLLDLLTELKTLEQKKKNPLERDPAREWAIRLLHCLWSAETGRSGSIEHILDLFETAVKQFRYFYKFQKVYIV